MNKLPTDPLENGTEIPAIQVANASYLRRSRSCEDATNEAQELFGRAIGICYGSFSCSHSRIRGRLYVSSRALLFYSSLLGFETRISLDFHDVLEIELFRTTSISVRTFEGETYVFKSFEDRNAALHLLETHAQLTSLSTLDNSSIASSVTNAPVLGKPRHRSASSFSSTNYEDSLHYNQDPLTSSCPGNRRRCVSDSIVHGQDVMACLGENPVPLSNSLSSPKQSEPAAKVCEISHAETAESGTWQSAQSKAPFQEIAVTSLNLRCSLEVFFETFLADHAEHSLTRYQSEYIQDRDVKPTMWEVSEESSSMTRNITFTHPIKAVAMGLGPSEARTKRHQRLWRFDQGMLLENTTHIEGIPHADTFCICDRWLIAQSTSTCVQLSSSFEIQFTKRSLFRSLIEKSVKRETLEWWTGYTKMIQDVLSQQIGPLEPLKPSDAMLWKGSVPILERLDRQYTWTIRLSLFVIFLLVCVLSLLVSLITVFAKEIKLLRAALEHRDILPPNCWIEEL